MVKVLLISHERLLSWSFSFYLCLDLGLFFVSGCYFLLALLQILQLAPDSLNSQQVPTCFQHFKKYIFFWIYKTIYTIKIWLLFDLNIFQAILSFLKRIRNCFVTILLPYRYITFQKVPFRCSFKTVRDRHRAKQPMSWTVHRRFWTLSEYTGKKVTGHFKTLRITVP